MHNGAFLDQKALEALPFLSLGANVLIHATCVLVGCERISIGDNVRIDPFTIISSGKGIAIGRNAHIATRCSILGPEMIEICDFVGVSHGATVLSASDDFKGDYLIGPTVPDEFRNVLSAPVRIGRHAVIGAGGVVLPGVDIGDGATLGAISLAIRDVPPWTVNVGVPTRSIGVRDREAILQREQDFLRTHA